jgi:hypothetical protein
MTPRDRRELAGLKELLRLPEETVMTRKPANSKTGKAPTPKPVSPEPPANDGDERLTDGDHMGELNRMKDRLFGLEAAIKDICDPAMPFEAGVCQLASDISNAMEKCAEAFEAERKLR